MCLTVAAWSDTCTPFSPRFSLCWSAKPREVGSLLWWRRLSLGMGPRHAPASLLPHSRWHRMGATGAATPTAASVTPSSVAIATSNAHDVGYNASVSLMLHMQALPNEYPPWGPSIACRVWMKRPLQTCVECCLRAGWPACSSVAHRGALRSCLGLVEQQWQRCW